MSFPGCQIDPYYYFCSMSKLNKLYLIPNVLAPDTHEQVLPMQVKEALSHITYFLVEEVRTARRFISDMQTGRSIENLVFYKLDKDTSPEECAALFSQIPEGEDIGVISEAGCPGVADPGALAVAYAHKKGMEVVPLVGPSSILLALMASGFNGQSFAFHGYLPIEKDLRLKAIKNLEKEAITKRQTQLFMETPYRNNKLLEDVLNTCQGETKLCIAADVTGAAQFIKTKKIKEWKEKAPDLNKRPTIFVLSL